MADATSEVARELQLDDQAYQELGEMSYPLSETRKELRKCEKRWRQVVMKHTSEPSAFIRCPECEMCGFVHDHFIIFDSDIVQLMCIEARLKDQLGFERCVDFCADDGDGKAMGVSVGTPVLDRSSAAKIRPIEQSESSRRSRTSRSWSASTS